MPSIERRTLLKGAAAAALATAAGPRVVWAADDPGPFKLPPLPYDFGALEPTSTPRPWSCTTTSIMRPT